MAFKWTFASIFVVLGTIGALVAPRDSRAGFLATLAKFFGAGPTEIEEKLPNFIAETLAAPDSSALDAISRPPTDADGTEDANSFAIIQENALLAPLNPLGTVPAVSSLNAGQIFTYTIRAGDTIGGIARSFGVSVNTILWANSISDARSLKLGDQIVILPISGVRHEVKKGDTLDSLAKKYRANADDIAQFNGLGTDETLTIGSIVIVPNGEAPSAPTSLFAGGGVRSFANLPLYDGYYIRPIVDGRRSRGIHGYNGVDLASSCGLPVLASAEGQVIVARASGWNGGYGRYIVINHPNNTQTLYAHLREIDVAPGSSVSQGTTIGLIGSSGNSTGCHVHFEVRGARNPF